MKKYKVLNCLHTLTKCLILRVLESNCAKLYSDAQDIILSTSIKKFHFWVKKAVFIKKKTSMIFFILIFATA